MLADLEARVMQVVWAADKAVSVREMREHVGRLYILEERAHARG